MKEYIFACEFEGKERWLQILRSSSGAYQVFWDANLISTVEPKIDDDLSIKWHTCNDILKSRRTFGLSPSADLAFTIKSTWGLRLVCASKF